MQSFSYPSMMHDSDTYLRILLGIFTSDINCSNTFNFFIGIQAFNDSMPNVFSYGSFKISRISRRRLVKNIFLKIDNQDCNGWKDMDLDHAVKP